MYCIYYGGTRLPIGLRQAALPREVISLTTYAQLDLYLEKFAAGEFGLLLLIGRHGTGKSESVRRAVGCVPSDPTNGRFDEPEVLYVEGHMQPFGLYRDLWEHRDQPAGPAHIKPVAPQGVTIFQSRVSGGILTLAPCAVRLP